MHGREGCNITEVSGKDIHKARHKHTWTLSCLQHVSQEDTHRRRKSQTLFLLSLWRLLWLPMADGMGQPHICLPPHASYLPNTRYPVQYIMEYENTN